MSESLVAFGTHATSDLCAYTGPLEFSGVGEDMLPLWEHHDGCTALARCGRPWSEHPTANGEPYCEQSSCPAQAVRSSHE